MLAGVSCFARDLRVCHFSATLLLSKELIKHVPSDDMVEKDLQVMPKGEKSKDNKDSKKAADALQARLQRVLARPCARARRAPPSCALTRAWCAPRDVLYPFSASRTAFSSADGVMMSRLMMWLRSSAKMASMSCARARAPHQHASMSPRDGRAAARARARARNNAHLVRVANRIARDERRAEHALLHERRHVRERGLAPVRVDAVDLEARVRRQVPVCVCTSQIG